MSAQNALVDPMLTTQEVADIFRVDRKTIGRHATRLGIGVNFGGRAGYRFTEADLEALKSALTPPPTPVLTYRRRRRRRSI